MIVAIIFLGALCVILFLAWFERGFEVRNAERESHALRGELRHVQKTADEYFDKWLQEMHARQEVEEKFEEVRKIIGGEQP